ncbi:MAG: FecR family protein [Tannerellaceae bacterium]|jgi:ferric-dicitrate binding protein FerR (iron transport regulator)|nr:FecR family protein [Tannerellaceae bacterium]
MDKELLQRYVEGNVTIEEIGTVVDWLDASEENVREFMALHKLYDISLLNKQAYKQATSASKQTIPFKKMAYELLKIAAIFLILWIGMQWFYNRPEEENVMAYQTLSVPAGQRAELTLPDNTKVWLNAKSKLTYPTNFEKGSRKVELDGEAFFDITYLEKQPFIVQTDKMSIEVLGTEFNVVDYTDHNISDVSLLKGSVKLKANGVSQEYILKVNEKVQLKDGKLHTSAIVDLDYYKWKEGLLCFNNETVGDIIKKLQLYFDIKIDVKRQELLKFRYTGKFRTKDGVEQVLKVLQLEHKFSYVKNSELNTITIK